MVAFIKSIRINLSELYTSPSILTNPNVLSGLSGKGNLRETGFNTTLPFSLSITNSLISLRLPIVNTPFFSCPKYNNNLLILLIFAV
jgi:hypothetical protein